MSQNRTFTTPEGILSYPYLFTPQPAMDGQSKEKYSCAVVFGDDVDLSSLEAAVLAAARERWGDKAEELLNSGRLRNPLREDGAFKNYPFDRFANLRTGHQPVVVSKYADPATGKAMVITDPTQMYPGARVRVSGTAYSYDVNGNRGVALGLNAVQKVGEGERLDGKPDAGSVFETVEMPTGDTNDLDQFM